MPINHTKKFLKSIHTVAFFWWLFSETLNFYFISVLVLIKMVINRKLLQRLISIYPRMPIVIREKWVWSIVYLLPWIGFWSRDCRPIGPLCEQWTVVNCTPVWHRRNLHLLSDDEKRLPRIEGNRAISNYISDLKFHRHRSLIQIPWYLLSFQVFQPILVVEVV